MTTSDAIKSLSTILTETTELIRVTLEADKVTDAERETKLQEAEGKLQQLTAELTVATNQLIEAKSKDGLTTQSLTSLGASFQESIRTLIVTAQNTAPPGTPTADEAAQPAPTNTVTETGAATSF